jgi:hypothetical protein
VGLVTSGDLLVIAWDSTNGPPPSTRIDVHRVTLTPAPSVTLLSNFSSASFGRFTGLIDVGTNDASARRLGLVSSLDSSADLFVTLDFSNPAALSVVDIDTLFGNTVVRQGLKMVPPLSFVGRPARAAVTRTPSRIDFYTLPAGPGAFSTTLSAPAGALGFSNNLLWTLSQSPLALSGWDVTGTPFSVSSVSLPNALSYRNLVFANVFRTSGIVSASNGQMVRVDITTPSAPVVRQLFTMGGSNFSSQVAPFIAGDTSRLHFAAGDAGYLMSAALFDAIPEGIATRRTDAACSRSTWSSTIPVFATPAITSLRWQRNGTPLNDGPTPWGSVISGSFTSSLSIQFPRAEDAGDYRLVAVNACGTWTSPGQVVTVCEADFNCDGEVDPIDIGAFFAAYRAGDADFDGNGETEPVDLRAFFDAYRAGC